jgi:superfamily I DNA/RNA helicase
MADYYFNLPSILQLSIDQQSALNETNPIALSGGPGTGKTVVSIYRHLNRYNNQRKSLLITFTTTLAMYLKGCCKSNNTIASQNIDSSFNWMNNPTNYQEIIVDEAQDLPEDYYGKLKNYSSIISYGADDAQILYPNRACCQNTLQNIFPRNRHYQLTKNYRSTRSIMNFAKAAFEEAYIPINFINSCTQAGNKPVLLYSSEIKKQNDAILNIIRQFQNNIGENIAILTPLATTPWAGGERLTARYYWDLLRNSNINNVSFYDYTMKGIGEIKSIHITPFKSSKGLEFDTVIIPMFNSLYQNFKVIDWRDFFVGATRAKSNLYLISDSDIPSLSLVTEKTRL